MAKKKTQNTLNKSIFKGSKNAVTKTNFTKKWIQLVNTLEKGKA